MNLSRLTAVAGAMAFLAPSALADLTTYSQDFEALDMADPAALTNDAWLGFGNVFDPAGGYLYGYGVFGAPNGGPGFSAIGTGAGSPAQGLQYIDIYSDYNNQDHANGNYIEALVFQEQSVGAANVGQTWTFSFDYLRNPAMGVGQADSTMFAFIKVIKVSDGSFATLAQVELETTGASDMVWASDSLDLLMDPTFEGEVVQFGFRSFATNFNDTSRLYDNIGWDAPGAVDPSLTMYCQDFEGLDMADPDALANDGFTVFANVFDPAGGYLYGYGTFPAPNGGPGFSSVAGGSGGAPQGLQYINVYSDYNNPDHANGNYIEALVFQEQPVGAVDAGNTWRFSFDYLRNPMVGIGEADSTMFAFIKVIKISDGSFATLALTERETTGASDSTWASSALDLLIDPSYAGELLQFGFRSYATNFNDTGRFYDNLKFDVLADPGIGSALCLGNPSSVGVAADLFVTGSNAVADNDVTLSVSQLPLNVFGYFLTSQDTGFVYNVGGGDGHLCIASPDIGRFANDVINSGATGTAVFSPDLTDFPTAMGTTMVMAGETHYFQFWFRDTVAGMTTSNLSGAACVTFN